MTRQNDFSNSKTENMQGNRPVKWDKIELCRHTPDSKHSVSLMGRRKDLSKKMSHFTPVPSQINWPGVTSYNNYSSNDLSKWSVEVFHPILTMIFVWSSVIQHKIIWLKKRIMEKETVTIYKMKCQSCRTCQTQHSETLTSEAQTWLPFPTTKMGQYIQRFLAATGTRLSGFWMMMKPWLFPHRGGSID